MGENKKIKGVILCGGKGTRLLPATKILNKHLLPVLNKPMVLYPIETLKSMGITDILIVSGGNHLGGFTDFLGDGSDYGVNLTYKVQKEAGGIAQALLLAEDYVGYQFAVILGDNYFESVPRITTSECALFVKEVPDPQRFGVFSECDISIEEKPKNPKSDLAVTGLYIYTTHIFDFIRTLKPSERGELEITDVNNYCLKKLSTVVRECDGFWSDMGTPESLLATTKYIYEKSSH